MFNKKADDALDVRINVTAGAEIDTIIGKDCKLHGDIESKSVKVDGEVHGNITTHGNLIIGKQALVKGNLQCTNLTVVGAVEGNIHSENLELKESAKVLGKINTKGLKIAAGAIYHGEVEMKQATVGAEAGANVIALNKEIHANK